MAEQHRYLPQFLRGQAERSEVRQSNRRDELARRRGRKVIACFAALPSRFAATSLNMIGAGLGVPSNHGS